MPQTMSLNDISANNGQYIMILFASYFKSMYSHTNLSQSPDNFVSSVSVDFNYIYFCSIKSLKV